MSIKTRISNLPQTDNKTDPEILHIRQNFPRAHISWVVEEDEILEEMCSAGTPLPQMAILLMRSIKAVDIRINRLGCTLNKNNTSKISSDVVMSNNPELNIIHYWRNSLADLDKMGLPPKVIKRGEQFSLANFQKGNLPANQVKRFFIEAEAKLKEKNERRKRQGDRQKNNEEIFVSKLQVIISPYVAIKNHLHGKEINSKKSPVEVFPLWIVADLSREGELSPNTDNIHPWIERRCLTPNEEVIGYPIIGDVTDTDKFYTLNQAMYDKGMPTWNELFFYALELFHTTTNNDANIFKRQNYTLLEDGYILPSPDNQGASRHIITTYDQYLFNNKSKAPSLLLTFASLKDNAYCKDKPEIDLFSASQQHLGQMEAKYPLSPSQRTSLSYLADEERNEIFTIHGPPGTGKTTLALSVMASLWVEHAINKLAPPILVVASTNNLAVTNILDNLNKFENDREPSLKNRWLPGLFSYGLYLASNQKGEAAEKNAYIYRQLAKNSGTLEKFYTSEYQLLAKKYYLIQFNKCYLKEETDIRKCQEHIHEILLQKQSLLSNAINFARDMHLAQKKLVDTYGSIAQLNELILQKNENRLLANKAKDALLNVRKNWFLFNTTDLKWLKIFSWLPFVKTYLIDKIKFFTANNHGLFKVVLETLASVNEFFAKETSAITHVLQEFDKAIANLESIKTNYLQLESKKLILEKNIGFSFNVDILFDDSNAESLLAKLDTTLRHELFLLASRYYEAEWLINCSNYDSLKYSTAGRKTYWEMQAMLTLCSVTTLHSGPAFFQHKTQTQEFQTVADFIDLLIIDEAGQVMPAFAGAMLSTAKRALLIGDTKQIEPIFKITQGIDLANTKKFAIAKDSDDYEQLKQTGILCSGNEIGHAYGNVILVGQRKAKYHLENHHVAGMFLREHRRCAKEIIAYCNELCYDNKLIPLTEEKPCVYPRMGYAHIKGDAKNIGRSWSNKPEAIAIVDWIKRNTQKILDTCQQASLDKCLAIITPFASQAEIIRSLLHTNDIDINKVGTVHSLQGAEKPIIIFSSVYVAENEGTYFFDNSPNMLNVAVSRAQLSFLVFGDMDIFNLNKGNQPSSLLAKYLFSDENNEIVDIIQPKNTILEKEEVRLINTLDDHRYYLKRSFKYARKELDIVSPYLRRSAIHNDDIPNLISRYKHKIKINIYTDPTLNRLNYSQHEHDSEFQNVIKSLETAGATVILVNNVHSKIIAIDDKIIIIGSFNWLSASRTNPKYIREEHSIIYDGKKVSELIENALTPIKNKKSLPLKSYKSSIIENESA